MFFYMYYFFRILNKWSGFIFIYFIGFAPSVSLQTVNIPPLELRGHCPDICTGSGDLSVLKRGIHAIRFQCRKETINGYGYSIALSLYT